MLAEQDFSTEAQLPMELQARAFVYNQEMAWQASDALEVIHWLSSRQIPVIGVELWRSQDGLPQWVATSPCSAQTAAECAQEAERFVREFQNYQGHTGNLFNLSWAYAPSVEK